MNTDYTILTPNRRLAATLLNEYHAGQIKAGHTTWKTPVILPLAAWLQTLWQSAGLQSLSETPPLLLTPSQAIMLWESILAASPESSLFLQSAPTAELAAAAFNLLKLWQVPVDHPMLTLTEDGVALQRWAREFISHCESRHWLDLSSLPDYLANKIPSGQIVLPKQIRLAGFTEVAPQYLKLFDRMRDAGCDIAPLQNTERMHKTIHTVCCPDENAEIRTMARWAKAALDQHHLSGTPVTIGCIIPRLDTLRDRVLQIFSEIFSDPLTLTSHHEKLPFNISAGKKFIHWPPVRAVFLLLDSTLHTPDEGEMARLKVSPFVQKDRAQLSSQLHKARLSPREWAEHIAEFLKTAGWPGERSLSSDEYQICQRWLELLEEFSTLHLLKPQMAGPCHRHL